MCPKIAGGGSAGPLGIGRVPELEPRATRPRVTQRGEISPLFDEAVSRLEQLGTAWGVYRRASWALADQDGRLGRAVSCVCRG